MMKLICNFTTGQSKKINACKFIFDIAVQFYYLAGTVTGTTAKNKILLGLKA